MPPKKKKQDNQPVVHPHILKRREADRIKAEKNFVRGLKNLKKNRNRTSTPTFSSDSSMNISSSYFDQASYASNQTQHNLSLPLSSDEPGISPLQGQQKNYGQSKNNKKKEKSSFAEEKSFTEPQSEDFKIAKNTERKKVPVRKVTETGKSCLQNFSTSNPDDTKLHKNQGQEQLSTENKDIVEKLKLDPPLMNKSKEEQSKINKKKEKSSLIEEKSLVESQSEVFKIPKNVERRKVPGRKVTETEQSCLQNFPTSNPDVTGLHKDEGQVQVATQNKDLVEKLEEKDSLKPRKPVHCEKGSSEPTISLGRRKETPNAMTKKKKKELQKRIIKALELERKMLEEESKKILSEVNKKTFIDSEMAVIGDIEIQESNISTKEDVKSNTYSYYDPNKSLLHVGDEHVTVSIVVNKGSQIICKSRRRPTVDVDELNVPFDSQIFGSQSMVKQDEDVTSDLEHHDKSTDSENISSIIDFLKNYQEIDQSGRLVVKLPNLENIDISTTDSEHQDKSTDLENISRIFDFLNKSHQEINQTGKLVVKLPKLENVDKSTIGTESTIGSISKYPSINQKLGHKDLERLNVNLPDLTHNESTDTKSTISIDELPNRYQEPENQDIERLIVELPELTNDESTDTKSTTYSSGELPDRDYQKFGDQANERFTTDLPDFKPLDEASTETNCVLRGNDNFSNENSTFSSLQENIRNVCDQFLNVFISICENFESRILNHIKSDKYLKK